MIDPNASNIVTPIVSANTVEPDHQNSIAPGSENDVVASGNADQDDGLGPLSEDLNQDPSMGFPLPLQFLVPRCSADNGGRSLTGLRPRRPLIGKTD
jgi:hypothetical protein